MERNPQAGPTTRNPLDADHCLVPVYYLLLLKGSGADSPNVRFWADPSTIDQDETAVLYWNATHALTASIDQGLGLVDTSGYAVVSPPETTTYTITAFGSKVSVHNSTTIYVNSLPETADFGLPDKSGSGTGLLGTVSILTGDVVEVRSDVSLATPNLVGFGLTGVYNSRSQHSGAMGFGWSHTFEVTLSPSVSVGSRTFLRINDATGKDRFFVSPDNATWSGVYGEKTTVTATGNGYDWMANDGSVLGFDAGGRLVAMSDRFGNRLGLLYDAADRLERVNDNATGRFLAFAYNGNSTLESLSGPVTPEIADGIWVTYGYDDNGNLVSVSYPDGSGSMYAYEDANDPHNLTRKTNALGHELAAWSYDDQDRCLGTTCRSCGIGGGFQVAYVNRGSVTVTDGYGVQRTYAKEVIGGRWKVTEVTGLPDPPYAGDNTVAWTWDGDHNLVAVEDAAGTVTKLENFDTRGNPGRIILGLGSASERTITYIWHPEYNLPLRRSEASLLAAGDKVTVWDYDDDGNEEPNENPTAQLSRRIEQGYTHDAVGAVVPFLYATDYTSNGLGLVTAMDGPLEGTNDTVAMAYDANGDLLALTRPLVGSTTCADYNAAGWVGRVTDVNDRARTIAYDGRGHVTSVTFVADDNATTMAYDAGLIAATTDEDGVTRTYSYNATTGQLIRMTDQGGNWVALGYDDQGNRVETATYHADGARASITSRSFAHPDLPGKLWREYLTSDVYTEYRYDAAGRLDGVVDGRGSLTEYTHDALGRITVVTQPGDAVTGFTYDGHGNQNTVTDAEGRATSFVYDDLGRVVLSTSPDTGATSFVYDAAGNLVQQTDARGITTTYAYDALSRLTAVHFPDPAEDMVFGYDQGTDGKGHRTSMTDPSGSTTFAYNARGRLTEKESTILGSSYGLARNFSPAGRIMSLTLPRGRTIDYTRDTLGRISQVATTYGAATTPLFQDIGYRPFGGPTGLSNGAGGDVANHFAECCGLLTLANPGAPFERQYTYDYNKNLTQITAPNQPRLDTTYTYDAQDRLTAASGPFVTFAYTYDDVGNRLTRTRDGATETYTYQSGTNRLASVDNGTVTAFSTDPAGNTIGIGDRTLVYNQAGRLTRVEDGNGTALGEYLYNAQEQRAAKTVDGVTRHYVYDFDGNLIYETKPGATWEAREYLYMGTTRIAMVDVYFDRLYFYQNDHLGTPQLLTDGNNVVVWEAVYDPFGSAEVNPNSEMANNHRFPGQYYDAETGYHYNWHRYYDPETGRYLRADPIGLAGGDVNVYLYSSGNTIIGYDFKGLARFGYRPLINSLTGKPFNRFTMLLGYENVNTKVAHQQIWFDNPVIIPGIGENITNIGFFNDNKIKPDDIYITILEYRDFSAHFDDEIIVQAIVNTTPKPYDFVGPGHYNCQDWIEMIIDEYAKIITQRGMGM